MDKINNIGLSRELTSCYDFHGFTEQEVWTRIAQKINIIIEHFNYIDKKVDNEKENNKTKFDYLLGEGLSEQVAKALLNKISDGTIGELINGTLLSEINNKVDNYKAETDNTVDDFKTETTDKITTFTTEFNSHLTDIDDKKFDKTGILGMGNMGQDVREAMTNGSVAVVGKYSVGYENYQYNSLDVNRTKFIRNGNNLFNSNDLTIGYLNSEGGIQITSDYVTTAIIPTDGSKFITFARMNEGNTELNQPRNIRFVCFYDSSLNLMKENFYDNNNNLGESVPIPENAMYFRLSLQSGFNDGRTMIYLGESDKYSFFQEYEEIIENLSLSDKTIEQIKATARKDLLANKYITSENVLFLEKIGTNIWNKEVFESGYIDINDTIVSDSNYYTSPHILIKGSSLSAYRFNTGSSTQTYIRIINFYDDKLNIIKSLRYDNSNRIIEKVIIPSEATYMRIVLNSAFNNDTMIVYDDEVPSSYQPYKCKLKNIDIDINNVEVENPLKGKILFNFGDSIAAGDGNNGKGYAEILGEMYDINVHDFAVGGATLGDTESNNITTQVDKAIKKGITPNYILLEGGTNDISSQNTISVGTIGTTFNLTDFDKTTTIGGLEYCLYKLKNSFPDAKIVFVSVHKMGSRNYDAQVERQKACIDTCEKWCIPTADIGKKGNLNTFLNSMLKYTNPTESQPNGDKTHPNDLGYRTHYVPIIYNVLIMI